QVGGSAFDFKLETQRATQSIGDSRTIRSEHARVRHDDRVARERAPVTRNERLEVRTANLFLAFEQALHIYGETPRVAQVELDCFKVCEELSFVVARTATIQILIAHSRLERRCAPFIERFNRLHVVMPV